MPPEAISKRAAWLAVMVASLGYFVDIYDLILFSIVGKDALLGLGVKADPVVIKDVSASILNHQMVGMLLGGLLWGMLGDKRGRLSVLFGSIILYSLANIASGLVTSTEQMAWLRFVAGVGLAGELGAGVTLVTEILDKQRRGIATTIIAGVGVCGALVAYGMYRLVSWRTTFFIGGGMGLALLVLRIGVAESGLFHGVRQTAVSRGNFLMFFTSPRRALRYLSVIVTGMPIWFVIGILMTQSEPIAAGLGMQPGPRRPDCVFYGYIGLAIGDFAAGLLSQLLRSRKKALALFVGLCLASFAYYFLVGPSSVTAWYLGCVIVGIGGGYWAVFATVGAEQFGTNLRATAATTAPNFVRGALVPMVLVWQAITPAMGVVGATVAVGVGVALLALLAVAGLEETYGKDLDFVEK